MRQIEIINILPSIFAECEGIKVALLIGSFARKQATCKSDIDYSLWVEKGVFNPNSFYQLLERKFPSAMKILYVKLRSRIAVYFKNCPKLELVWYEQLSEINLNFLGSEIKDVSSSIAYEQPQLEIDIEKYLFKLTNEKNDLCNKYGISNLVKELADKFIYEFESASHSHNRSDGYKFYFFYNIALDVAIKLNYLATGKVEHYYLPKKFDHIYEKETEQKLFFRGLNGTLYLPEASRKKRNLLNYFYKAIEHIKIHSTEEIQEIKNFLEEVYLRDIIWNFRDVATISTKLKPKKIFRASSLARYQNESFFADFIRQHRINKVIDLRGINEYAQNPYSDQSLKLFTHLHLSIEPKEYYDGIDTQSYRIFAREQKRIFKAILEQIDPEKDTFLIHCYAGKDRTGCVVALLSLLAGENIENIKQDYLESEMDTQVENLYAFLEMIVQNGNVEHYLLDCEINQDRINYWKRYLTIDKS